MDLTVGFEEEAKGSKALRLETPSCVGANRSTCSVLAAVIASLDSCVVVFDDFSSQYVAFRPLSSTSHISVFWSTFLLLMLSKGFFGMQVKILY